MLKDKWGAAMCNYLYFKCKNTKSYFLKKLYKKAILCLLLALLIHCQNSNPVNNENGLLKIMYLGDSITQGALGGDCTYTTYLTDTLHARKVRFELVGSVSEWGIKHEGHFGWRADSILQHIAEWTRNKKLDIVLCHLGTNDLEHEHDAGIDSIINRTIGDLEAIIDGVRFDNPDVSIFVAQIIPHKSPARSPIFQAFNGKISGIKQRKSTEKSQIYIVNHYSNFSVAEDLGDDVHPNKSGAIKMTEKWINAFELAGVLN